MGVFEDTEQEFEVKFWIKCSLSSLWTQGAEIQRYRRHILMKFDKWGFLRAQNKNLKSDFGLCAASHTMVTRIGHFLL